jgi:hypothetical protein
MTKVMHECGGTLGSGEIRMFLACFPDKGVEVVIQA